MAMTLLAVGAGKYFNRINKSGKVLSNDISAELTSAQNSYLFLPQPLDFYLIHYKWNYVNNFL